MTMDGFGTCQPREGRQLFVHCKPTPGREMDSFGRNAGLPLPLTREPPALSISSLTTIE